MKSFARVELHCHPRRQVLIESGINYVEVANAAAFYGVLAHGHHHRHQVQAGRADGGLFYSSLATKPVATFGRNQNPLKKISLWPKKIRP